MLSKLGVLPSSFSHLKLSSKSSSHFFNGEYGSVYKDSIKRETRLIYSKGIGRFAAIT